MNRIQFFYDDDLIALEQKINEWLAAHTHVKIIDTNLSSLGKPSQRAGVVSTEKYVFFILYSMQRRAEIGLKHKEEEIMPAAEIIKENRAGLESSS